jgi:hypothetical protein
MAPMLTIHKSLLPVITSFRSTMASHAPSSGSAVFDYLLEVVKFGLSAREYVLLHDEVA